MISDDCAKRVQDVLTNTYAILWSPDRGRQLFKSMAPEVDDSLYEEGVRRHTLDGTRDKSGRVTGALPPTAAHIMAHVQDILREREYGSNAEAKGWHNVPAGSVGIATREIPEELRGFFPTLKTFDVIIPACRTCSDNGYQRFYFLKQDPVQVFLVEELDYQPPELLDQLSIATAHCDDCDRGRERGMKGYPTLTSNRVKAMVRKRTVGEPYAETLMRLAQGE